MFAIGTASALGSWLIGLPDVLVLAVLAGLLEAVPMVGGACRYSCHIHRPPYSYSLTGT
jgi:predicted PurR-regulated permease PerM